MRILNRTRQTVLVARADVAGTSRQRRKGLLGRSTLPAGQGLWINPCESVHTIGMRFAIDLVYLDRELRVRKVKCALRPWRVSACLGARSVLELATGSIVQSNTQPGDLLEIQPSSYDTGETGPEAG